MTQHGPIVPETLGNFIKKGYTDIVGVSVYHPHEADEMLKNNIYTAIQFPMNIFDTRFIESGVLQRFERQNIAVFVRSIFFQGLFFLEPEDVRNPVLVKEAVPYIKKLRELAGLQGMEIGEFAISFVRDTAGISSLVLGADTDLQIIENIKYFNAPMISKKYRDKVESAFRDIDIKRIMEILSKPKK